MIDGKQSPKSLRIIVGVIIVLFVLIGFALIKGMIPTKIVFPVVGGSVELNERHKDNFTILRITVLGSDSVPVEDAHVWLSIGGEAKKVTGGWEFEIPLSKLPVNHKLDVYAEQQNAHLKGHREIIANDSRMLAITIPLIRDISAFIKGTVSDDSNRPVVGATINIVGSAGSVTTDAQGFFSLPANAAEGEEVRLRVSKSGYEGLDQYHPAGNVAAYIILRKKR